MTSNRSLCRIPPHLALEPKQLRKLKEYPRQPIITTHGLLSRTELELVECCDWSFETARVVQRKCAHWVAPKSVRVREMLGNNDIKKLSPSFFTTTLVNLDFALGGGIHCASVTEIVGPPRCGKTQFCLTLSVQATLPIEMAGLDGGVCFIDTEGSLSADRLVAQHTDDDLVVVRAFRLVEIAETRYPQYFSRRDLKGQRNLEKMKNSIHILDVKSSKDMLERLKNLQEFIIMKKIRIVIIDSIGSLVMKEYRVSGGSNGSNGFFNGQSNSEILVERNNLLVEEAKHLKFLAESFHIPIIVTNQLLVNRYNTDVSSSLLLPSYKRTQTYDRDSSAVMVTAALGNTWAHSVTTRLIIEFCHNDLLKMMTSSYTTSSSILSSCKNIFRIKIAKSSIAPNFAFYYYISSQGVVEHDPPLSSNNETNASTTTMPTRTKTTRITDTNNNYSEIIIDKENVPLSRQASPTPLSPLTLVSPVSSISDDNALSETLTTESLRRQRKSRDKEHIADWFIKELWSS
ncbi:1646_t:CDS:2 [Ambispora gerdemannii]|uniref:1646_t:CDS:1 n=1 Tax=Ambispora gerdemannii TaxID=144530 RepID=A0A9N8VW75_9GLOM|nr:1646_t:CDS:2 [Ambispora gerdemannii]